MFVVCGYLLFFDWDQNAAVIVVGWLRSAWYFGSDSLTPKLLCFSFTCLKTGWSVSFSTCLRAGCWFQILSLWLLKTFFFGLCCMFYLDIALQFERNKLTSRVIETKKISYAALTAVFWPNDYKDFQLISCFQICFQIWEWVMFSRLELRGGC